MAEVLITLAIIGIVAAMTLPGLIGKWQNKIYVARLKKVVNTLENGFHAAMADDIVDNIEYTGLFSSMTTGSTSTVSGLDPVFLSNLKKYFNILELKKREDPIINMSYLKGNDQRRWYLRYNIVFQDGSVIYVAYFYKRGQGYTNESCKKVKQLGGHYCKYNASIWVDVNGYKNPNKLGRDIFAFYLGENGNMYPYGGRDVALANNLKPLNTNSSYWRNSGNCGKPGEKLGNKVEGLHCAGRIIENGWIMDY